MADTLVRDPVRDIQRWAAAPVRHEPWQPAWWVLMVVAAIALGMVVGGVLPIVVTDGPPARALNRGPLAKYEYHLWRWEANTLTSNAFARLGIGPDPQARGSEDGLRRYFALTSQLRSAQEADAPNASLIDALASERAAFENDTERVIEGLISEALEAVGLSQRMPLFRGVRVTWPPVDFELTSPPRLLVRSPRDRIERDGDSLLKNDLALAQIESIEKRADSSNIVSIVVAIGGIAAYPAIVRDDRSYDALLETASHEWVHHYLAFYPLGKQWGKGGDAETLNETTASIADREIASLVRKTHPLTFPAGADGRAPAGPTPTVDFNVEMRKLRLEVDNLLKDGKVAEAERVMEERRVYLGEHGIAIRKLNQAYFAFFGTYGDSPASSNPVGPKVERVWSATHDIASFLIVMREVRNMADLDRALATLEGR